MFAPGLDKNFKLATFLPGQTLLIMNSSVSLFPIPQGSLTEYEITMVRLSNPRFSSCDKACPEHVDGREARNQVSEKISETVKIPAPPAKDCRYVTDAKNNSLLYSYAYRFFFTAYSLRFLTSGRSIRGDPRQEKLLVLALLKFSGIVPKW